MTSRRWFNYNNNMTQRELTIIRQLLTAYLGELRDRTGYADIDKRRLIDKSIRAIDREQQINRNDHLIDTLKSWVKNTKNYLFRCRAK